VPVAAFIELAPDWLCEVLSPSTAGHDRVRKLAVYLREGVRHVWFIDPAAQTLEVLRLEEGRWLVAGNFANGDRVRAEPFEAVELELALLWQR
jgi:Uma2 family endonuclease